MTGMKGLVAGPTGETIELPIKSSFKEGFNVLEYFIATHGARKGMADTALRTATAGYLTRRLVDVAQDAVVRETDCGDQRGSFMYRADSDVVGIGFSSRIMGRILLEDAINPKTKKVMFKKDELITKEKAEEIEKADSTKSRSVRLSLAAPAGESARNATEWIWEETNSCRSAKRSELSRRKPLESREPS